MGQIYISEADLYYSYGSDLYIYINMGQIYEYYNSGMNGVVIMPRVHNAGGEESIERSIYPV